MEVGPDQSLSASVVDALLAGGEDEQIIIARNCWVCGWTEERSVVIDSIETTESDADAVERAALLDDIMSEARQSTVSRRSKMPLRRFAVSDVSRRRRLTQLTTSTVTRYPS